MQKKILVQMRVLVKLLQTKNALAQLNMAVKKQNVTLMGNQLVQVQVSFIVTPQVVDKFAFYSIKLNRRHPERSEGSPAFGTNQINLRSFATLRMTYLGCYDVSYDS